MQADIRYNQDPAVPLHLDFYRSVRTLAPVVVWIHGGAWQVGSREITPTQFLNDNGYAVASISYRFTDVAIFPAQIQDCKCAIRFLRANAKAFGIDAAKIGVWGASAGGHLAAMLAITNGHIEFEGDDGYGSYSSDVQAACDWFGPSDLVSMLDQVSSIDHAGPESPEGRLVGGHISRNRQLAEIASPISHVAQNAAPMLIVHGTKDAVVPCAQSTALFNRLKDVGAEAKLLTYEGSGHGDGAFLEQSARDAVLQFFRQQLPF
jgi:acetyl esterase/lipase